MAITQLIPLDVGALTEDQFEQIVSDGQTVFVTPSDFPDALSYLVALLYKAPASEKRQVSRFAFKALAHLLDTRTAASQPRLVFRLLRVLTAAPHSDRETVARRLHAMLIGGRFRRLPDAKQDIHRQALFCLAEHPVAKSGRSGLSDYLKRCLNDPAYALAAQAAMAASDPQNRAVDVLPRVLALLQSKKMPTELMTPVTASRLGGDKRLWTKLGHAIARAGRVEAATPLITRLERDNKQSELVSFERGIKGGPSSERAQPQAKSDTRRVLAGTVTRDKMTKTRRVEVERLVKHPRYGKYVKRRTVCYVHDEYNVSHLGDLVEIVECRPLSRTKRWQLIRVVTPAPSRTLSGLEGAVAGSDAASEVRRASAGV